ncbi:ABC transporter permease [Streptomyces sp. NBC_01463]
MTLLSLRGTNLATTSRRRLRPGLLWSAAVLLIAALAAVLPGLFTGRDPLEVAPADRLLPPGGGHLLGTDQLGRDMLSRMVHGAAPSLQAALIAVVVGVVVGGLLGAVSGFGGGAVDGLIMRGVDVLLAIPGLLLSLTLVTVLGYGTVNTALAVGFGNVPVFARVMRSEVLRVRGSLFVEAARSYGAKRHRVLALHVLPNARGPVLALAALSLGTSVLAVSALSFLGYGAPPPAPEWGSLVAQGRDHLADAWWLTTLPGLCVALVALAANRVARALDGEIGEAK